MLPESLSLGQRTLEDVFLQLTGREVRGSERATGTFTPMPGAAPLRPAGRSRRRGMETRLLLRNGEQLLLALVIPVLVLVAGVRGIEHARPVALAHRRSTS